MALWLWHHWPHATKLSGGHVLGSISSGSQVTMAHGTGERVVDDCIFMRFILVYAMSLPDSARFSDRLLDGIFGGSRKVGVVVPVAVAVVELSARINECELSRFESGIICAHKSLSTLICERAKLCDGAVKLASRLASSRVNDQVS